MPSIKLASHLDIIDGPRQVTLVGESFGGCLALRVAAAAPELVARMVLVNPATCFRNSLGGLSSLVAATNLLSIFPRPLYEVRRCCVGGSGWRSD